MTGVRAQELEKLLNGDGYAVGVTAEGCKVWLHQAEADRPYNHGFIQQVKEFAKAWNKFINAISI